MMITIIHREQATKTKKMIIHLNREQHIDIGIGIVKRNLMILNMIVAAIEIENDRRISVDISKMIDQRLMNVDHIQMDENPLIQHQENVNTMIVEQR